MTVKRKRFLAACARKAGVRHGARVAASLIRGALLLAIVAGISGAAVTRGDEFREGLAIGAVGRGGRSPVTVDAVQAQIVSAKWRAPNAGDELPLPDGTVRTWEPVKAREDGQFQGLVSAGGYVFFSVPSEREEVRILEAAGHAMSYVNGEPRAGDPYSHGTMRLPVAIRQGANEFLFQVARGQFRAKLVPPRAEAQFDLGDLTVPDFVVGEAVETWLAVPVLNLRRSAASFIIEAVLPGGHARRTECGPILPMSTRKVACRLGGPAIDAEGQVEIELRLLEKLPGNADQPVGAVELKQLDSAKLAIRVVTSDATRKQTFISDIDGSVQYFGLVPANIDPASGPHAVAPALILTLHGAGVEGMGQANAYLRKDWAHIVAPTNRRSFGFDWEDWGRLDALEVLAIAQRQLNIPAGRTYLTGHSMGGHGTWQLAAHYPDRFAAIGPSAGWISMMSYAGGRRQQSAGPFADLLARAASASDTLALVRNFAHHGVYVLHGEKDDNVPVEQARTMKRELEKFHQDFQVHEEPGVGHWWGKEGIPGTACVDWPPMWDFFRKHTPPTEPARDVEFITASPGISATCHWVTIESQLRMLKPSSVRLRYDAAAHRFSGQTDNVARLSLDASGIPTGGNVEIELDGQKLPATERTAEMERVRLCRGEGQWTLCDRPALILKGPHRYGPFKEAFRNRVVLVYGTKGTPEENAWSLAKARYDAESFWYRGNGSLDVIPDHDLVAALQVTSSNAGDRLAQCNVIVYGHAESNDAWSVLLHDSPVVVRRGLVRIGGRELTGNDLGCLFIRPRPGTDRGAVAVIGGSGLAGMRLCDRMPYFVSGVGYPDCLVVGVDMLTDGWQGIRAAGFFGQDWSVDDGEFVWRPD